jgi:hypothetical protein
VLCSKAYAKTQNLIANGAAGCSHSVSKTGILPIPFSGISLLPFSTKKDVNCLFVPVLTNKAVHAGDSCRPEAAI